MKKFKIMHISLVFLTCISMLHGNEQKAPYLGNQKIAELSTLNQSDLIIMSINAYCFDTNANTALQLFNNRDLMDRTAKPAWNRIEELAAFIKKQTPLADIITFQELWLDDHKKHMIENLKDVYPYAFYLPRSSTDQLQSINDALKAWENLPAAEKWQTNALQALNPLKMDSGLLILAKQSIQVIETFSTTYTAKMLDEQHAFKGAIGIRCIHNNKPFCVITTHLQSGPEDVIRDTYILQLQQLAELIAKHKQPEDGVCIVGDLNIRTFTHENVLVDTTYGLVNVLNRAINKTIKTLMLYNPIVEYVTRITKNLNQILFIDTLSGFPTLSCNPKTQLCTTTSIKTELPDAYMALATAYEGNSIIDHCICSTDIALFKATVFREVLGDSGPAKPYDRNTALTDHAPILFFLKKID